MSTLVGLEPTAFEYLLLGISRSPMRYPLRHRATLLFTNVTCLLADSLEFVLYASERNYYISFMNVYFCEAIDLNGGSIPSRVYL